MKILLLILIMASQLLISGCESNNITNDHFPDEMTTVPKHTETDYAMALTTYWEFLRGERKVEDGTDSLNIQDIFNSDSEDAILYEEYAFFDMNGDGIPELHLLSDSYYILSYKNGDLIVWYRAWNYSRPLNNGAILLTRPGGAPTHISYAYTILDCNGKEILNIFFEKYASNNDDKYDTFFFQDVEVSENIWVNLTEKYLSIGSSDIKWFKYSEISSGIVNENSY